MFLSRFFPATGPMTSAPLVVDNKGPPGPPFVASSVASSGIPWSTSGHTAGTGLSSRSPHEGEKRPALPPTHPGFYISDILYTGHGTGRAIWSFQRTPSPVLDASRGRREEDRGEAARPRDVERGAPGRHEADSPAPAADREHSNSDGGGGGGTGGTGGTGGNNTNSYKLKFGIERILAKEPTKQGKNNRLRSIGTLFVNIPIPVCCWTVPSRLSPIFLA